ncbi:MAG: cation:proton antiporter [Smithellaceae bacterium]|jgi:Kef-type K+ transport system membrane component KefB|nr:cation:proton antiporter [Smithellaceae bacterium]MDD3848925.1 cation:proton antiporter [Smithellaceae bacterium]
MHSILPEIGIAVLAATAMGFLFQLCRQPVILGYLVAGALIGPQIGFSLVSHPDNIEVISEIGLILLLFIIGLELNPAKLLSSGKKLIYAGVGQFIFCVLIGLGFFVLLGYPLGGGRIEALYLSLFCALSSTAIVVKLLYDKFELDTLPGRISLGILIFQDLWAILILALQPNFMDPKLHLVALALGKGVLLLAVGFLLSRFALRWIFAKIAKTPEMVVATSIAWCAFMAGLGSWIGMSMEMGALIAGAAIASFPYGVHVTAKVLPLRDFFLTLFFLSIGMKIPFPDATTLTMAVLIVLFVIASRFLTIYPILKLSGSGRRTSFITSLNLAQISEFSLVVAALGVQYGHIQQSLMSLIIYAMAITSVLSSYFIKGNHAMYLVFDRTLTRMGFPSKAARETAEEGQEHYPIVLLGYHRGARAIVEKIEENAPDLLEKILVIDFNLEILKELENRHVKGIFGDISSMDTLDHAHVAGAEVILSTIPDMLLKNTSNLSLVKTCRMLAPHALIVATADAAEQAEELKNSGANEVLLPYSLIGETIAEMLLDWQQKGA